MVKVLSLSIVYISSTSDLFTSSFNSFSSSYAIRVLWNAFDLFVNAVFNVDWKPLQDGPTNYRNGPQQTATYTGMDLDWYFSTLRWVIWISKCSKFEFRTHMGILFEIRTTLAWAMLWYGGGCLLGFGNIVDSLTRKLLAHPLPTPVIYIFWIRN